MSINPKLLKAFDSWSRSDLNLILLKKGEGPLTREAIKEKSRLIAEAKALFAEHAPTAPLRTTIEAILASKPAKAAEAKAAEAKAAEVVRKEKKAVQKPPAKKKKMSTEECVKTAYKLKPYQFTCDLEYLSSLGHGQTLIREWLSNIPTFLKSDLRWVAGEMAFQGLDTGDCDNFEDVVEDEWTKKDILYIQLASLAAIFVWIIPDCGVLVLAQIAMRASWYSYLKLYRNLATLDMDDDDCEWGDLATDADGDEEGEDYVIEFIRKRDHLKYAFQSRPEGPNGKVLLAKMLKVVPNIQDKIIY